MIFLVGCSVIVILAIVAIARSKKPLKTLVAETKCEILLNVVGTKSMIQDFVMKGKNKIELPMKTGKIAVITGGTRGIGLEVIKMLLQCDITVVIGCRNIRQGEALLSKFRKEDISKGKIDVLKLDISVIESVREFAKTVQEKYTMVHYLINNAGIMFGPYVETRDGYESQFSTNYLGHFLLTHLLLPRLKDAGKEDEMARIVNVSSCAHMAAPAINFADINNRSDYITGAAYAQSKLAQILFTNYLDDLLKKEGDFVQVHAVHPGIVNTELFDGTYLKNMAPWLPNLFFKSPEQGAIPIVYACLSSNLEGKGGTYITNCEVYPPSELAKSTELQKKLFDFTKDILKIEEFGKK